MGRLCIIAHVKNLLVSLTKLPNHMDIVKHQIFTCRKFSEYHEIYEIVLHENICLKIREFSCHEIAYGPNLQIWYMTSQQQHVQVIVSRRVKGLRPF